MSIARAPLSHPTYRPDIDGLRALAVVSAIVFHAFPEAMRGGFIGVDIFFVISGYLISTIIFDSLDKGTFSFAEFYGRRIRRIFPALLLLLAAVYAFGWFVLLPEGYKQLGKHIAGGAGFVSNIVLWNEAGYFDKAVEAKPLLHLWSLGVEEQFYIVWPLLLWCAWKGKLNFLIVTTLAAIASFALNKYGVLNDRVAAFYAPQTRFWELLCGSLLAWWGLYKNAALEAIKAKTGRFASSVLWLQEPGRARRVLLEGASCLGLALLLFGFWRINKNLKFPGDWALIPVAGTVLVILAGQTARVNRVILSNRVLVWIGLISFPLYLWHWPLLVFARMFEGGAPSAATRVATVLIAVVLAWLTYLAVERPLRADGQRRLKAVALVCLMSVAGSVGYITYKRDGLPFRIPKIARELIEYTYDHKGEYREGTCFLREDQTFEAFSKCRDDVSAEKKTFVIWGDSYAAHLYPGLKYVFGEDVNFIQRTASLCPPIMGLHIEERPLCRRINGFVMGMLRANPPDHLIMSAAWSVYNLENLGKTIERLKANGIKTITIIGPTPQWNDGLPQLLYNAYLTSVPPQVPRRMSHGLNEGSLAIDAVLKMKANELGVGYVSAKDILCNADGCLTRIGETADTVVSWDAHGHLTAKGSEFLVSKFPRF